LSIVYRRSEGKSEKLEGKMARIKIDNVLLQEEFRSFNDAKRKNAGISFQAMSVNILNSKIDGHHLLLFVSTEYYFPRHSRVYAPKRFDA